MPDDAGPGGAEPTDGDSTPDAEALRRAHGRPRGLAAGLRIAWRIPALTLVTLGIYLAWLLTGLLGGLRTRAGRAGHFALTRTWARACCGILGVRIELRGRPPASAALIAGNHVSYLDIVVLMTRVRGVFIAKSEIASWPVLGFLARTTGTIFVDRRRRSDVGRVNELAERALRRDVCVVLFPEATSTRGARVQPFKASIFEVAARTGLPVRAASLAYRTPPNGPPADLAVCWWGDMPFFGHFLGLLGLPSVHALLTFSDQVTTGADRKNLAERAQRSVEAIFTPTSSGLPTR